MRLILWLAVISIISFASSCQQGNSASNQEAVHIPVDTIPEVEEVKDTLEHIMQLDYIMGRFDPKTHPDFILIDMAHADKEGMYLRRDTYAAFLRMSEHAKRDSIRLQIRSATRNFSAQKGIWEAKWTGARLIESGENLAETTPDHKERALKILRYSSMPGSSRHHWGTDIDLNNFENDWFTSGEGLRMYNWLVQHAPTYGFCQTYTAGRPHGYWEERWHWSYTPVSARLTEYARTHLKNELIDGFLGSDTAPEIGIVEKYVLGINDACNHLPEEH